MKMVFTNPQPKVERIVCTGDTPNGLYTIVGGVWESTVVLLVGASDYGKLVDVNKLTRTWSLDCGFELKKLPPTATVTFSND